MADISRRIFGADFNEDVKKVLETRQALAKEAQPLESIENHSENYKSNFIDGDQKILSDLGSRTPFCRMWTAVQIQKHTLVETIDNSEGDFNIKEAEEKDKEQGIEKIYRQVGDDVEIKEVDKFDSVIYSIGNNKLNLITSDPNEPVLKTNDTWGNSIFGENKTAFEGEFEKNQNEFLRPPAGIISVNSETEGSFGLVKKTTINFKVNNFHDFDEIYSQYFLRPGQRIFVDFGWDTTALYDPEHLIRNFKKDQLTQALYGDNGIVNKNVGHLEVLSGNVVDYNSSIKADNTVECSVTIMSQNTSLIDHSVREESEAVKKRIVTRLDYEIVRFAASHFGADYLFNANFENDPATIEEYTILSERFASANLKHGKRKNVPTGDALKAGVYWQEIIGKDGKAKESNGKNLYVCWGLFEDFIMNHEFSFGTSKAFADSGESKFESINNFTRWDRNLFKRQVFDDSATELAILYPDDWSYNDKGWMDWTNSP